MTDDRASERDRLVDRLRRRTDASERVLSAVRSVPRHAFVPDERAADAYADRPLPIGEGQTISAPHMVAVMCDLLELSPSDRVLEIGTGCGYHAAVTAELCETVSSVEYHERLARQARERLATLGYETVRVRVGDGREGWPEHAPYDACYLTCAAREVPDPLVEQVRPGGVLVAPVGDRVQRLVRLTVGSDGIRERTDHGGVRFVPLLGDH
ncbi:protein-L-isoaspartate(D-aspartate) O-methyltransferase [Halosegnis sp.]|uniref:protein-L-isoaspartate(D-aspartate) O-methyltransferase n=1 Tax=Halosegnis sp. TaxID=2864959 RepID=UPI0035D51720